MSATSVGWIWCAVAAGAVALLCRAPMRDASDRRLRAMGPAPRDRFHARGDGKEGAPRSADDARGRGRGVGVALAGMVAALDGGADATSACMRQIVVDHEDGAPPPFADHAGGWDPEALRALLRGCALEEEDDAQLERVAHGMRVARELSADLGCSMARCLDAVRESHLRARLRADLRRNAFAPARATVRMLMGLPVLTLLLGELLGADPLAVLFGSTRGLCCLLLGALCLVVGGVWMCRLLRAMAAGS